MSLNPSCDDDAVLVDAADYGASGIARCIQIIEGVDRQMEHSRTAVWRRLLIRVPVETDQVRQIAAACRATLGVPVGIVPHVAHGRQWELDVWSQRGRTVVLGPK